MGWGFGHAWQEICSYSTERLITFVDWRLGIPYKLMCVAILYYICTTLLVTELYLSMAFPVAVFDLWASATYKGELGAFDYVRAQQDVFAKTVNASEPTTYCANDKYNFKIMDPGGDEFDFKDVSCVYLDHSEASQIGEGHLLLVTALRNQYVAYHKKKEGEECSVDSFAANSLAGPVDIVPSSSIHSSSTHPRAVVTPRLHSPHLHSPHALDTAPKAHLTTQRR